MKKIIAVSLAIVLCLVLVACSAAQADAINNSNAYQMDKVAYFSDECLTIYREPVTDVLYMVYDEFNSGGVTVMLDPETGLPMTYTNYLTQYNEKFSDGEEVCAICKKSFPEAYDFCPHCGSSRIHINAEVPYA